MTVIVYLGTDFIYGFPCACGGVKYLATVPILVAKFRLDTLVNARSLKKIPNTGLGRNCGNDFCSVFVYSHDVGVLWH